VTGATGYVAGVLIRELLQQGFTVHATVRDASQRDALQHLLQETKPTKVPAVKSFSFPPICSSQVVSKLPVRVAASFFPYGMIAICVAGRGNARCLQSTNRTRRPGYGKCPASGSWQLITMRVSKHQPGSSPKIYAIESRLPSIVHTVSGNALAAQASWVIAGSQTQLPLATINPSFVMGFLGHRRKEFTKS
jgi:NAD(P)-dependent dehydrogenase (short-subunit alcohol dehydrogenase family)